MTDELKRFFKSIDFNPEENYFSNAKVAKVVYLKQKDLYEVYIECDTVLPYPVAESLFTCAANGIKKEKKCIIRINYQTITKEDVLNYLKELIKELTIKRPSLINLNEALITIEDEIITIEVSTKLEELEVKKEAKGIIQKDRKSVV